jgi:tRNA modification GTPase
LVVSAHIDTIYAPATPMGRSSVAVVRVSGPAALESLKAFTNDKIPRARAAALCTLKYKDSTIDRAVVIVFKGPKSYTGEDIVEYHLHGGRAVIDSLIAALAAQKSHRLAEPGEFTRRAFENGKVDLTEAEAVADLINAETEAQKHQALSQMEGALSKLYAGWTEALKKNLAHAEAEIEFPDEDLPGGIIAKLKPVLLSLASEISQHLSDNRRGERLRDGIHIAVIGAPNTGKSTLVNGLAQRDIAIVSDMPGTTRDIIEAHLDLGGYPVILSDTAGLRPGQLGTKGHDAIESEGIRRAVKRAADADLKIILFDAGKRKLDPDTLRLKDEDSITVFNKRDFFQSEAHYESFVKSLGPMAEDALFISAETGEGLEQLTATLLTRIKTMMGASDVPSLTRARHRAALEDARACLQRAQKAKLPELMAEDMRLAVRAIGRITGKVTPEDLLDVIFRDFCIGK